MRSLYFAIILLTTCCMCTQPTPTIFDAYAQAHRQDTHSYANPSEALTTHLTLSLEVDFDKRVLSGIAAYDIANNRAEKIVLDTRDLTIDHVYIDDQEAVEFELSDPDDHMGQALTIPIKPTTSKIFIHYATSPNAVALQWLSPGQTADKQHPFLFTQGQAILTRSWIPCQDSPGIRITYDAEVTVPSDLMAVMSASNPKAKNNSGMYTFAMKQPIPPYLLALAVGDLRFKAVGPRTGVYAEPSVVDAAHYEFGDMEKMLESAEAMYGPYLWDQYDVIVLPPSFPFGGMENPRLTFATPTILAGDRSLTALIAHELAHSWSGNLVTNGTWNDFWLNEGFTVYFERRIMEALYGDDYVRMLAMLGYQDLEAEVEDLGPKSRDTHLHLDLVDRDPDDGMTQIAYEKGAYFLTLLEQEVGRETFDAFLKTYFDTHKFRTITTAEFVDYLKRHLLEPNNVDVDIDAWIYAPGIPDNCPRFVSDKFEKVDAQVASLQSAEAVDALSTDDWTTHEWLHFIRHIPTDTDATILAALDDRLNLSRSGNSEILAAWFELAIRNGYYKNISTEIESFLVQVGRRKFLTPLYRALKESGDIETARAIYAKARSNYHSVSTQTMDALLQ